MGGVVLSGGSGPGSQMCGLLCFRKDAKSTWHSRPLKAHGHDARLQSEGLRAQNASQVWQVWPKRVLDRAAPLRVLSTAGGSAVEESSVRGEHR